VKDAVGLPMVRLIDNETSFEAELIMLSDSVRDFRSCENDGDREDVAETLVVIVKEIESESVCFVGVLGAVMVLPVTDGDGECEYEIDFEWICKDIVLE